MSETVVLGLLVGAALGALMARGGVCFNAALRRAAFGGDTSVLRVFAVAVAAQLVVLPALALLGWVSLAPPGLFPAAQVVGGLVFGAGMALAGGCVTGVLWKAGAGSVATAVAVAGFALGELLIRGPWRETLGRLDGAVARPAEGTLHGALGLPYELVAGVLGVVALVLLRRGGARTGLRLGLALGALSALAWAAADRVGAGYGLGFTGTASNVSSSIVAADPWALGWSAFLALGVVGGAALAVRGPVRRPDGPRLARALAGGVLMGVGASMAHGCNIGLGLAGIPTLSLGSMLAVAAMAVGAVGVRGLVLEPFPALRGVERPGAAGW